MSFEKEKLQKNCNFLEKYSKEQKLIYLPEEDVILIDDNKISIIGNKKYVIFRDEKYTYHNFANLKKDMMNKENV